MKTRLVTPPFDAITTTITTFGCSRSTSMRWIVAVCSGGAVTSATRSVTWESVVVVSRIATSTSRLIREMPSSSETGGGRRSWWARSRST